MAQEQKYIKTILCLANSRKMSGRCLAGREIDGEKIGAWIRPVSAREHEEISENDRRYEDGHTANLLDIVSIPMVEPKPATYQSENHLIADQFYWTKSGSATWAQIEKAVDSVGGPLWVNGHSSAYAMNDQVPEAEAAKLKSSLLLIKPSELKICVALRGNPHFPQKRSVRAHFSLNKHSYDIGLTDALMERKYLQGENGTFPVPNALLCVSLGEPFKGYAYKLAAALITPNRVGKSDE
jgi:hypothetical protein